MEKGNLPHRWTGTILVSVLLVFGDLFKGGRGKGGVAKPVVAFKTTLLAYDCESYFAIVCGTAGADL